MSDGRPTVKTATEARQGRTTGVVQGAMQRTRRTEPPRPLRAEDGRAGRLLSDPQATKFSIAIAPRLPLDPDDATQASPYPAVQRCQLVQLAEAEISGPSPQQRVQVSDHPIKAYPAMSPCQSARPILEPSDGLVGDTPPGLRVVRDREAKERSLPRPGDGTLLRVDLQLETPLDEAGQILHDPVACLLAADIDVAVIRVSHETVATVLKFAIQFVQHEIREQWRERTTLRGALPADLEQPVVEHSGRQIAPDKPKHPPVPDARCHAGHESVVIDPVKRSLDRLPTITRFQSK